MNNSLSIFIKLVLLMSLWCDYGKQYSCRSDNSIDAYSNMCVYMYTLCLVKTLLVLGGSLYILYIVYVIYVNINIHSGFFGHIEMRHLYLTNMTSITTATAIPLMMTRIIIRPNTNLCHQQSVLKNDFSHGPPVLLFPAAT